ncbi:hypothetical protein EDB19DRAFT_1911654 [Suillus lakei]|nr:hypothetical protein EDB19DRAFT_1911654 [Suillus lakei]
MSSLPHELLLLIFRAVVDNTYNIDDRLCLDSVILASVCYEWRSLVLSTPRFWTRLHMVTRLGTLSREHLETYVKRSSNAPLDIVIYVAPNSDIWIGDQIAQLFDIAKTCLEVLRECSHRWRSLRIIEETNYTSFFYFMLSVLGLPHAPALKEVEMKILTLKGWNSSVMHQHFGAPSLTHLSLRECNYITDSLVIFRKLLSSAQNLVSLELHQGVVRVGHAETDDELRPIILPTLRTLSVIMGTEKPAYLDDILGPISAPNLHHLEIHGNSLAWDENSLPDFISPAFFHREDQTPKFPSVHKLTMKNMLQSMHGPGKNLRSIFFALPRVTEAVLDHDVREIADQLALESYNKKAPPLWPCLRQLTIEMPTMTKFHYLLQLSEWLRLRRASGALLPGVVIRYVLHRAGNKEDARDLTAIRRIVNDTTGYRTSDTRVVVKQLGKLSALVDLRVNS